MGCFPIRLISANSLWECGGIGRRAGLEILQRFLIKVDGISRKVSPFFNNPIYTKVHKNICRDQMLEVIIFSKNLLNIHSAFSIGNITASPRYIKIGIPKVKQAPTKKTKRQNKALPLFDFSRPLQTPKNQAPFFVLIIEVI